MFDLYVGNTTDHFSSRWTNENPDGLYIEKLKRTISSLFR